MHVNSLLQYDDVLRQQREIIYKQRDEVLESENMRDIVENMIHCNHSTNVVALLIQHEDEEELEFTRHY